MFIQNYEELDGACQEQAEFLGDMAKAIMVLGNKNPYRKELIEAFRVQLMSFSLRLNRPIEICNVRGEIWINIRERKPITKEQFEAIFSIKLPRVAHASTGSIPAKDMEPYFEMLTQKDNLSDRIQSQWRW